MGRHVTVTIGARPLTDPARDWPWWRLGRWALAPLDVTAPASGYRLWLLTRWGDLHWDVLKRPVDVGQGSDWSQ